VPGVFVGGDAVSGPASVIEAIAAGRRAAVAIDEFLGGKGKIEEVLAPAEEPLPIAGEERAARAEPALLEIGARTGSMAEVDLGLSPESAFAETKRCLKCDQVGYDCGACGHATCRAAVAFTREQQRKVSKAGVTGGWGWIWRGPSCIWRILEFGIACDWACATAHNHNVPSRPQMIPGGLLMRMGYVDGATAAMALPLGPCRESWHTFEPGSGRAGAGYGYEGAIARQMLSSPNLWIRFLGPGRDMGRIGMKVQDRWWESPYTALEMVQHPEWDDFSWARDARMFEVAEEVKRARKARKKKPAPESLEPK